LARSSPIRPDQAAACRFRSSTSNLPSGAVGDDGVRRALLADQRGQRAGVDAGQAMTPRRFSHWSRSCACAVVRRIGDVGLEDRADRAGASRRGQVLDVLVIGADIADMRKGEGDDLAGIGGIGEDLLVAGQRRVEADFRDRFARGAEASALDDRAVGQHQQAVGSRGPWGSVAIGASFRLPCSLHRSGPYHAAKSTRDDAFRSHPCAQPWSGRAKRRTIGERQDPVNQRSALLELNMFPTESMRLAGKIRFARFDWSGSIVALRLMELENARETRSRP
jgi:hypothetical protein